MHQRSFSIFYILLLCIIVCLQPSKGYTVNVRDFGAKGDGISDDTRAINAAISGAFDGLVEFPRGSYRITKTIEIDLSRYGAIGLSGRGASASVIMAAEGAAFSFIGSHAKGSALPSSVKQVTWDKERMPLIDALEIVGDHINADGIELRNTLMPTLRALLIRNVRNGIHLTSRNRNILIDACHIYNNSGIGIFLDQVNIHQFIISDSHISYCKKGGIKVFSSEIRNFQITGNDIEYNCDPEGPVSADILVDCSRGGSVREGTISGNTIQAIPSTGGANIRFLGLEGNPDKIGLWSITGNHISNQELNIHLENTRGISITGNTFIRGYNRHLLINNGRNLIINGNVFDHNEDYFPSQPSAYGGILLSRGENVIMSDNIIDGSGNGNKEDGGAIVVTDSREISITDCHIKNPIFNGILIERSINLQLRNCIISEGIKNNGMLTGILLKGLCTGTLVKDNSIGNGKISQIKNMATGVILKENTSID
ncbi:MAG: right-handed parallel beta-helix repeat-containing protein [Daejeonella sp.]|uniref:right-handed parallel beta-helix repeat-containing protein n=1 Tax=Daejeonella sp. TaxID=2805397 RepID=UPI0027341990|nr:right-handed parallel beta-helix repeat-containing protein [Daejeonella sp.]MDP3468436.1 right-handed parallel beta-helix repeat-containing protein [Daejeonella sp.]